MGRRRRGKRRYPRAYARMTWRGPRAGINWTPIHRPRVFRRRRLFRW